MSAKHTTYYDKLFAASQHSDLGEDERKSIDRTLKFIHEHVSDAAHLGRRSLLLAHLDDINWPSRDEEIWHTIIHAYADAVSETLQSDSNSIRCLPAATVTSWFSNTVIRSIANANVSGIHGIYGQVIKPDGNQIPWSPGELTWDVLRRISSEVHDERRHFQSSLCDGEPGEMKHCAEDLILKISNYIRSEPSVIEKMPSKWWWRFGAYALGNIPIVGGAIPAVTERAAEKVADSISSSIRKDFTITLRNRATDLIRASRKGHDDQ